MIYMSPNIYLCYTLARTQIMGYKYRLQLFQWQEQSGSLLPLLFQQDTLQARPDLKLSLNKL